MKENMWALERESMPQALASLRLPYLTFPFPPRMGSVRVKSRRVRGNRARGEYQEGKKVRRLESLRGFLLGGMESSKRNVKGVEYRRGRGKRLLSSAPRHSVTLSPTEPRLIRGEAKKAKRELREVGKEASKGSLEGGGNSR